MRTPAFLAMRSWKILRKLIIKGVGINGRFENRSRVNFKEQFKSSKLIIEGGGGNNREGAE